MRRPASARPSVRNGHSSASRAVCRTCEAGSIVDLHYRMPSRNDALARRFDLRNAQEGAIQRRVERSSPSDSGPAL